jgi:hypothetical protein
MNDTNVSTRQEGEFGEARWLLLIAQLPPKPDYLRVKLRRRVQRIGAIPVRSSVFALPNRADTVEDFVWLRTELLADGADAFICTASPIAGLTDTELEQRFRSGRDGEYQELIEEVRAMTSKDDREEAVRALPRMRRRLDDIGRVDFFGAERGAEARSALAQLSALASGRTEASPSDATRTAPRGRTWVTREDVFVDRIASAWLVSRFIDRDARFKFVPARGYEPLAGEVRFDMYDAEYTHEGDRCTFETLLARFALAEPALGALAEIVHDIDCKDAKYDRPEAAGVEAILAGLVRAERDDARRIEQGRALMEALYAQLGGASG